MNLDVGTASTSYFVFVCNVLNDLLGMSGCKPHWRAFQSSRKALLQNLGIIFVNKSIEKHTMTNAKKILGPYFL